MGISGQPAIAAPGEADHTSGLELWARLFCISAGAVVAYGLSRFAYALLLPAMKTDLQLDYSAMGALGTANNVGYLIGALLAVRIVTLERARPAFLLGLALTALCLVAMTASQNYWILFGCRVLGGIPAAFALVAGGLIATHLGGANRATSALALNIYYCGGGLGIFLSTFAALPVVLHDASYWPLCWLILGLMAFATVIPAYWSTRTFAARAATPSRSGAAVRLDWPILLVALAYFCYGVGYAGYVTFIVACVRERSADSTQILLFWAALGAVAIVGGLLWTRLFSRLNEMRALAIVLLVIAIGSLLPVQFSSTAVMVCSAVLFGSSFLSVVAAVNYATRAFLPLRMWAMAIATMTAIVGLGQIIGPIVTGWLADMFGLSNGLALSPASLVLGSAIAFAGSILHARHRP